MTNNIPHMIISIAMMSFFPNGFFSTKYAIIEHIANSTAVNGDMIDIAAYINANEYSTPPMWAIITPIHQLVFDNIDRCSSISNF